MSGGPQVRSTAVSDAVANNLGARIASGELRPGDRLPGERELAETHACNRSSVREALRRLEQLRLVETRPGSGTRVRDPHDASFEVLSLRLTDGEKARTDWVAELLDLRVLAVEGSVRALVDRGGADALAELARALRALAGADLAEAAFEQALAALPAQVARAAGNRVLLLVANSIARLLADPLLLEARRRSVLDQREAVGAALQRLAVALEARDAVGAERASRDWLGRVHAALLAGLGAR